MLKLKLNSSKIILFIICLVFLSGCIKKKHKPVNLKEDVCKEHPLLNLDIAYNAGIKIPSGANNIVLLENDTCIIVEYYLEETINKISSFLVDLYQSEDWSVSQTLQTNDSISFSCLKDKKSITVVIIKKNKNLLLVHASCTMY